MVLLPEPETPITTSAQGNLLPTKILRNRGAVHQPDRLAGGSRAVGGQVLGCEQARQDRALFRACNLEQHFAAGAEGGQREGDPRDEWLDIRPGYTDDPARRFVERGVAGKQRCGMAVGTNDGPQEIEKRRGL